MSRLTDKQEILISVLPIPASLLSIFGSLSIIRIACRTRKTKRWTPYTRLLIAISCCDIIYSITMSLSAFLLPSETSDRVWAVGNDITCTTLGFFSQFFVAVLSYNGMLSFYFLLSARMGVSNKDISRKYEPWMHVISLGYPLSAGVIGLFLGVYHENELGQGCWVNNYPENCGDGPGESGETCQTVLFGWIFGGAITIISFISIVVNNLFILVYVVRQTRMKQVAPRSRDPKADARPGGRTRTWVTVPLSMASNESSAHEDSGKSPSLSLQGMDEEQTTTGEHEDSTSSDEEEAVTHEDQKSSVQRDQLRRLQLVASQAVLYVAAFSMCTVWTGLLQGIQSATNGTDVEIADLEETLYPILVLQAIFLPLQGVFNFCVYVRPKYIKCRLECPHASRYVVFQHILNGKSLPPNEEGHTDKVVHVNHPRQEKKRSNEQRDTGDSTTKPMRTQENQTAATPAASGNCSNSADSKRWDAGVVESPLTPIAHNLTNNTVSSVTISQVICNDSTLENNKWEQGGSVEDSALSPVAKRLPGRPSSSATGDFDDFATEKDHWRESGSSPMHMSLPPIARRLPSGSQESSVTISQGGFDESTAENTKWEQGGSTSIDTSLPPIAKRLKGPLDSSVTISQSDPDFEQCYVAENNKWEGGSSETLPPIAKRLPDQSNSSIAESLAEESLTSTNTGSAKWQAGGSSALPSLPVFPSNPRPNRLPRVSSLEMISEVTMTAALEIEEDPLDCMLLNDSASEARLDGSSSSLRTSSGSSSVKSAPETTRRRVHFLDFPTQKQKPRWSAAGGSRSNKKKMDLSVSEKEKLRRDLLGVNRTTMAGPTISAIDRSFDRMKAVATAAKISADSPVLKPKRRLSPPPSSTLSSSPTDELCNPLPE